MGDAAAELDLALEALQHALVAGDLRAQDLERDRFAQLLVDRLVDLAHGAVAQEGRDPVASRQHLAHGEATGPLPVRETAFIPDH